MRSRAQIKAEERTRFWKRVRELADADPKLLEAFKGKMRRKRRVTLSAVVGKMHNQDLMRKVYAIGLAYVVHRNIDELVGLYWQAKRDLGSGACEDVECYVRDRFKSSSGRPLEEVLGLL